MKKLFYLLFILGAFSAKASVFQLNIATVDTAYAKYVLATNVVDTDIVHITALGSEPTPPVFDSTGSAWDTYVTALNTYDSSLAALNDSLFVHKGTQRTKELAVLTTLGYGTQYTNICVNQWVKVQGTFTTAWIGFSSGSTYLSVTFLKPKNPFPDTTH
jgi:hypothetical protein